MKKKYQIELYRYKLNNLKKVSRKKIIKKKETYKNIEFKTIQQLYLNSIVFWPVQTPFHELFDKIYFKKHYHYFLKTVVDWDLLYKEKNRRKVLINQQYDVFNFLNKTDSFENIVYLKSNLLNLRFFFGNCFLYRFLGVYVVKKVNFFNKIKFLNNVKVLNKAKFRFYYPGWFNFNKNVFMHDFLSLNFLCFNIFKKLIHQAYTRWFVTLLFKKYIYQILLNDWQALALKNFNLDVVTVNKQYLTSSLFLKYVHNLLKVGYTLMEAVNFLMRLLQKHRSWIKGIVLRCKGRFTRKERASYSVFKLGKVSFSTLSQPIDHYSMTLILKYGSCNLTLWLSKY